MFVHDIVGLLALMFLKLHVALRTLFFGYHVTLWKRFLEERRIFPQNILRTL